MDTKELIIVRGGGDIATGTICRLHTCGFRLLILETASPQAIRRTVSLSEAVYDGRQTVEGTTAIRIEKLSDCLPVWQDNNIPLFVDPQGQSIAELQPRALIDGILAKKNCLTNKDQADITIGIGPGFIAGENVHAVIETARGHNLGRVILDGSPQPNTGIPGSINGYAKERVIYAPEAGPLTVIRDIGSPIAPNEVIAKIGNTPVSAPMTGRVRGIIRDQYEVYEGMKIADIDPRIDEMENCYTISDKARAVGGGVVEALLYFINARIK